MTKFKLGFSLIEVLIVIALFATIATVAAESTLLSLRSARKADTISEIRDNLDFAVAVIERQTRNAQEINSLCEPTGTTSTSFSYVDEHESNTSFSCEFISGSSPPFFIASGSARLTSDDIELTECTFICTDPEGNLPKYIDIHLVGEKAGINGSDQSVVSVDTRVMLRAY